LAGREGTLLTARLLKNRLDAEVVGNVSIRVLPLDRPDAWTVQGRGELQLAVLVETLRREGFELTVGRPEAVTREIDGRLHEPVDALTLDMPEEYLGVIMQLAAGRKASHEKTVNHGTGRVRLDYLIPARGLIGFHTQFLTATRGTGLIHHVFHAYEPWYGEIPSRPTGSLVADRRGSITGYAVLSLQDRGTLFFGPGVEVYEGMIVGESPRAEDLDVNPTREKKLTNMRSSTSDATEKLTPPASLSLEQMLEFIRQDECLEVTPASVRPRKVELVGHARARQRSRGSRDSS
jgi:GTP-binding protein